MKRCGALRDSDSVFVPPVCLGWQDLPADRFRNFSIGTSELHHFAFRSFDGEAARLKEQGLGIDVPAISRERELGEICVKRLQRGFRRIKQSR